MYTECKEAMWRRVPRVNIVVRKDSAEVLRHIFTYFNHNESNPTMDYSTLLLLIVIVVDLVRCSKGMQNL